MTTPNGGSPDGAFQIGGKHKGYMSQAQVEDAISGNARALLEDANDGFAEVLASIAAVLAKVAKGLVDGIIAAGGFVIDVGLDIVGGIVRFFDFIAAAVKGKGPSAVPPRPGDPPPPEPLPDRFGPGPLADIADGQRELIDKIEGLEDNAGFCNLTMSNDWLVSGRPGVWLRCQFDTYVAKPKNAAKEGGNGIIIGRSQSSGAGTMLLAPGVWDLDTQVVVVSGGTVHFEVRISVWRVYNLKTIGNPTLVPQEELYSQTILPGLAESGNPGGVSLNKPLMVSELVSRPHPTDPTVTLEDEGYKVVVHVRAVESTTWTIRGGTTWSSLSANRLSTDITDYNPPAVGSGTVPIGNAL